MTDLQKIAANNSADPVLANFEGAVRDGLKPKPRETWRVRLRMQPSRSWDVLADGVRAVCGLIQTREDSRLIAAAPDLLAACEAWLSWDYADNEPGVRDRIRNAGKAAIAKATGQPYRLS